MNITGLHVIVVGGAIGGAASALLLARAGASVTLLERVAHPRAVGAGIAIQANGLAVLESLGLGPALAPHGRIVGGARIVDGAGRTMLRPPSEDLRILMLRRSALHTVLLDALEAEPRITVRLGAEVIGVSREGVVRVRTSEGFEELEGDLVVGADGVRSSVRERGSFGARLSPPGIPYVRAIVRDGLARNEEAWTSAGIFGSFPVDGGTYIFASASTPECQRAVRAGDLEAFRAAWSDAYGPAEEILGAIGRWEDLILNHVLQVECERWHDGRIVLVGDAAHAMAPNLGQGANSALVDAAVLLDELRAATSIDAALASYTARRRPAVQKVAVAAARLGALAEPRPGVVRWLRDHIVLPLLDRVSSERTLNLVMQESPETLLAIGRK